MSWSLYWLDSVVSVREIAVFAAPYWRWHGCQTGSLLVPLPSIIVHLYTMFIVFLFRAIWFRQLYNCLKYGCSSRLASFPPHLTSLLVPVHPQGDSAIFIFTDIVRGEEHFVNSTFWYCDLWSCCGNGVEIFTRRCWTVFFIWLRQKYCIHLYDNVIEFKFFLKTNRQWFCAKIIKTLCIIVPRVDHSYVNKIENGSVR